MPSVPEGLALPEDIRSFYQIAGGAVLFAEATYPVEVVSPEEFVRANPIIRREPIENDRSFDWFIIAQWEPQYITVDLNPARLGRCYDSFWDIHAMRGQCPVIACSFTELLEKLLVAKGQYLFWLALDFSALGDAYSDLGPVR
jgi:hypothetical protein